MGVSLLPPQLAFTIDYHKNSDKFTVVGVRVAPSSIDYTEYNNKLIARTKLGHTVIFSLLSHRRPWTLLTRSSTRTA